MSKFFYFSLSFFLFLIMSCKSYEKKNQKQKSITTNLQKKITDENKLGLIDHEGLGASYIELENYQLGPNKLLQIKIEGLKKAYDYIKYSICSLKTKKCDPTTQEPRFFVLSPHIISNPLSGDIEIKVSFCLKKEDSLDQKNLCTPWQKASPSPFFQEVQKDPVLTKLLLQKNKLDSKIHEICEQIQKHAKEFLKNPEDSSTEILKHKMIW